MLAEETTETTRKARCGGVRSEGAHHARRHHGHISRLLASILHRQRVALLQQRPTAGAQLVYSFLVLSLSLQLFQLLTWLGYANSSANPIIYSIFNRCTEVLAELFPHLHSCRDFRRAFHRILLIGLEWCPCMRIPRCCENFARRHKHKTPCALCPWPRGRKNGLLIAMCRMRAHFLRHTEIVSRRPSDTYSQGNTAARQHTSQQQGLTDSAVNKVNRRTFAREV